MEKLLLNLAKICFILTKTGKETPIMNLVSENELALKKRDNEEKKSWELEADKKARIQTGTAKIARNYREQQKMQTSNSPLQKQEDIKE